MKLLSAETVQKYTQTPGGRTEIEENLAPVLFAQYICGHQILDPNWSLQKNSLKVLCSIFLVGYVLIGTKELMQKTDSIQLFAEAILTLILTSQFLMQLIAFTYKRVTFCEVYIIAKTSLYSFIKEISPENGLHLLELLQKITKVLFLMIFVPASDYLITALWFYFNGTRVTLSRSTSILMPMSSPTYEIGLFLHLFYLLMLAFGLVVVDMWFVFLIYTFFEACDCAVKILQVKRSQGEEYISYANRLNEALRKFYSVHIMLMQLVSIIMTNIRYLNTLNVMYKWPILVPMFVALANTCVFLLVWSEESNWQLAVVIMTASIEIFAYNVLGEKIKSKAEDMKMALLNFDWINMSLKDRKNYCIIVSYMNKDFGIRTAVGLDLSLLTLSSIYKGSYQAFAVLNTIKST